MLKNYLPFMWIWVLITAKPILLRSTIRTEKETLGKVLLKAFGISRDVLNWQNLWTKILPDGISFEEFEEIYKEALEEIGLNDRIVEMIDKCING